ncbi:MAG: TonB-dependent receptor [Bacteroidales bacterium]|nr:TonB-dependent receptor [Bacteroidales bacterium]
MKKIFTIMLLCLFILISGKIFPQEGGFMLNIEVVTASKEAQAIEEAPAIIDVISEQQIRDFNATNLYELISYLPGIENMETYFGRTVLNFRGIKNIHYTNKVLLMINGNPMYDVVTGAYYLEAIPVSSISRIEIISGPGSSLYGTNAYSGVINIITKTGSDENDLSAKIGYGSFNTINGEVSGKYKINDDAGVFLSAEIINSDGYDFNVTADEKGKSGNIDYVDNVARFYGNAFYKNISIEFGVADMEKSLYGLTPNLNYKGTQERTLYYTNAKFSHKLGEDVDVSLMGRYNYLNSPSISIGYFPFPGFPGHDTSTVHLEQAGDALGLELQVNSKISEKISNVSGIVYESFNTDPYLFIWDSDETTNPFTAYDKKHSSYDIAGYTQFSYKPVENLNIVAGLRAVKEQDIENIFVLPRGGIILTISDKYFIKALYGKAFRSPSFFEKYVSTQGVLWGSTSLSPEEIQTFDLGFEAVLSENFKAKINGFYEETSDEITRIPSNDTTKIGEMYANITKLQLYGIEFSANGKIADAGYYGFNISWKEGENPDDPTGTKLKGIAPITSNFWLSYKFKNFTITPFFQYIGKREGTSTRVVDGTPVGDYSIDPYLLANLSVGVKFNKFTLSLVGKNLLDVDYTYPEYIRGKSEEVPGGPGLNYMVNLRFDL